MQVNRASASSTRSASVRTDAAGAAIAAAVSGVAPIGATENGLSDDPPPPPYHFVLEDDGAPEQLIDAIDAGQVYRVAASMLRREGMVGLLLNRNA